MYYVWRRSDGHVGYTESMPQDQGCQLFFTAPDFLTAKTLADYLQGQARRRSATAGIMVAVILGWLILTLAAFVL